MLVGKVVGFVAVVASLVACANDDDTSKDETTSDSQSHLSSDGLGNDIPMPDLPQGKGPWDEDWTPPQPAYPQGPGGASTLPPLPCEGTTYQKIYDPGRAKYVLIPIHICN